jgi:hypothetical protein
VVRNFATTYPHEVAGIVLVDASFEGRRVGHRRQGDDASGRWAERQEYPATTRGYEGIGQTGCAGEHNTTRATAPRSPYNALQPAERKLQLWAQSLPGIEDAENSQREWSAEYFAKWMATPQGGTLGTIPLVVLTRAEGGYSDGDYDIPPRNWRRSAKRTKRSSLCSQPTASRSSSTVDTIWNLRRLTM